MLEQRLLQFIETQTGKIGINKDTFLFSDGLLDSINVIDLVAFVEVEAGITIPTPDIMLENLDSINSILAFVLRKKEKS